MGGGNGLDFGLSSKEKYFINQTIQTHIDRFCKD
jgi:hypothetical protein